MVMPLPSHLRLPTPTTLTAAHPRSPVKKHLHNAVITKTTKLGSPQKLKVTVASSQSHGAPSTRVSTTTTIGSNSSRLRAATLQAVLSLVDRDDEELHQLLPLLHTLATLPLENPGVRRQCSTALQQIYAHNNGPPPEPSSRVTSAPTTHPLMRDSGRAKSTVSLRHCKAFLLACANEIHELEEVNPCFDYAEETSSDAPPPLRLHSISIPNGKFDYASTVESSSSRDDDDVRADTGSQLSELLYRTVEAEKADRERSETATVFYAWLATTKQARANTKALTRAFAALKKNRAASTLSRHRKQRAFGRLKQLLAQPKPAKAVVSRKSTPLSIRMAAVMLVHWDLVLLLVIACVVQLLRSA